MARRLLVLFFAVLAVVALGPVRSFLTKPREVISSTPSLYTGGVVALPVPAHGRACEDQVLFDTDSQIARFRASVAQGRRGAPLLVEALGTPPARYATRATVPAGWTGQRTFDVRLRPPPTATMGQFCVTNLSGRPLTLEGRNNDRTASRPQVTVNGEVAPLELPLVLLRAGEQSLASRPTEVLAHASTLRPLGVWWWWLLAILMVTAVPLGMALAIRSATALDRLDDAVARPAPAPTAATAWPGERTRQRLEAIPGWAIVAIVAALAVVYLGYWGLHTHAFQNDEDQYVYLSRWMQLHLPESLWNFDVMQRGLQRLEVWLLAVPAALLDSPDSLAAGRLLNTLVFISTAIPVYLIARGLGLGPRWAALPSALSMVVPWAVVTTSFLTENIAYPACLWALWAIWRTAVEPGPGRDALALVLLFVAGLSRTAMLLLVPLLPFVVLAQDLRFGAEGSLRHRVAGTLRSHALLWAALVLGGLVVALGALGIGPSVVTRLAGVYGTPFRFDAVKLLFKIGQFFSRSVVGTGFFAAALALPWLFGQLVRPTDRSRFAFALTAVGGGAIILYMVNSASFDERYIVYLAPLIFVPATVAIARREISPLGFGIASVLLALLLLRVKWNPDQGDFGFFVSPAEMFYGRGVAERLDLSVPGDRGTVLTLVPLALALIGVAIAATLHSTPARLAGRAGAVLVGAVVLCVLVQTNYALSKYVNSAGSKSGPGLRARAFADEQTPAAARIGEFAEGAGKSPEFIAVWQEIQFYNQRLDRVYSVGPNVNAVPPGDELIDNVSFDPQTGLLRSSRPLPDYLVIATPVGRGSARVRGELLASPRYIPAALIRVARPARLAWSTNGLDAAGVVGADGGAVRIYRGGLRSGAHCATVDLGAPASAPVSWRARVGRRAIGSGRVQPGALQRVTAQLPGLAERDHVDVKLGGHPRVLAVYVDQFC